MKSTARLMLIAAVLGLIVVGVNSARPTLAADLGLDFWNVPSLQARLAADRATASKLATRDEQVLRRIAVKETIIEDLVSGRIGLLDAAAEFRALNAGRRGYALVMRGLYPNMTDEERICRNVITYVESYVEGDEDGRGLIHRLNEDLGRLKAADKLHLPGPPLDLETAPNPDEFDDAQ